MMLSLTMVMIKTGLKVKVFILSNTNPCQSGKKFCGGVPEDLSHFLSECVGDQKENDKPPMIEESSLLYFTWPKRTKRSRPEGIPRHGRDHGTRNRDVRI